MRNRTLSAAAYAAIALSLASCDPKSPPDRYITRTASVSLLPDQQKWFHFTEHLTTKAIYCHYGSGGLAPDPPSGEGRVSVGFEHSWDPGTLPAPCKEALNHIHRGAVLFNLGELQKWEGRVLVEKATLKFKKFPRTGRFGCDDRVLSGTADWVSRPEDGPLPPAEERYPMPVPALETKPCQGPDGKCSVDVKSIVNDWAVGSVPHFGFVLAGENESYGAKDNNSCRTDYGQFELQVDYRYDERVAG
jgi:hypothetical protein